MKNQSRQENVIYLAVWGILFLAPLLSYYVRTANDATISFDWTEIMMVWQHFGLYLLLFVIHNFLLAPLLIHQHKRLLYFSAVAVIVVGFATWQFTHHPRRFHDRKPPMEMRGDHPMMDEEHRPPQFGGSDDMPPKPHEGRHHFKPHKQQRHVMMGEREIAALQERLDKEKNLTEESRAQLAELIKGKQAALDAELEQMATDAANALTEEQVKAEEERAMRILEYKRELAESGSEEELAIQKEILDAQMAQELENVELSEEEKYLIRETFAKKAEELDKQYHDNLVKQAQDARAAYKESLKATAASASQTFGAMSDLLSSYGEENEAAAKASKAFGIAQIITDQAISIADTAKAISAAVAGATAAAASTGPAAPFVLAGYIAAMVGAVLSALGSIASTIAQAKQLMSSADTAKDAGKYAGGGTIPGTSYTGDKLIAHVNSGEGIYTGSQANNLLQEIANNPARGGFDYSAMAEAMAVAVAAQPAPVMSYQEFTDFQQKVATYNELAKI